MRGRGTAQLVLADRQEVKNVRRSRRPCERAGTEGKTPVDETSITSEHHPK